MTFDQLVHAPTRKLRIVENTHPSNPVGVKAFWIYEGSFHIGSFSTDANDSGDRKWLAQKLYQGQPFAQRSFATREEAETFAAQR